MNRRRHISGVFLLDKPVGRSSNTALGRVRWLFNAAKAGHTGTLDPFATGLLPIALGEAAKFSRFMLDAPKAYLAELRLGVTTTTGDTEGTEVERRNVSTSAGEIESVLQRFRGPQTQVPPMHSALKRDGIPLYKLARQGIDVDRPARPVTLYQLHLCDWDGGQTLRLNLLCSKGTYVRVLAEDIGAALGCGAHLTGLRRTGSGDFSIDAATTLDELEALPDASRDGLLLPPDRLAQALPVLHLNEDDARAFGNGGKPVLSPTFAIAEHRVYGPTGEFLGVGQIAPAGGELQLVAVRLMASAGSANPAQPRDSA